MRRNRNMSMGYKKVVQKLRVSQLKRGPIPVKHFNKIKKNQKRK